MWFFTADEHYGHANIIKHCNRPFSCVEDMNEAMMERHNRLVGPNDITVHAGDFCWCTRYDDAYQQYIRYLNGNHIFIKGSHDSWLPSSAKYMWRKMIDDQFIVVCHYAMRTWERAHYGSWQLHGHSHGTLPHLGKQLDVGVDTHDFYPYPLPVINDIMESRELLKET
jgi:calcineurin-like phosphoesterase family protein